MPTVFTTRPRASKHNRKIRGMPRPNDLVLITGGAGFIGSHTDDRLAAEGFRIRIVDNLQPPVHAPGEWGNAISTIDKIKRLGWAPRHTPVKSVGDCLFWIRTDGLEGTLTKGIADLLRSAAVVEF